MKAPLDGELNPNHGVAREFREQWHKLCAIMMHKLGYQTLEITAADIESFARGGRTNISMRAKGNVITLNLHTDVEAVALARKEGGLPV